MGLQWPLPALLSRYLHDTLVCVVCQYLTKPDTSLQHSVNTLLPVDAKFPAEIYNRIRDDDVDIWDLQNDRRRRWVHAGRLVLDKSAERVVAGG